MSLAIQAPTPQSASLALSILQSKAGNRWGRAVEEMKTKRLRVEGDFPEFVVTNKSGTGYKVKLDPHGNGSCTCPDFQVRIAQEGRICKHIAAAAIIALAPQVQAPSPTNGSMKANGGQTAEVSPLLFRIRRNVQTDGKGGVQVEVQARVTNDEVQDRETAHRTLRKQLRSGGSFSERGKANADQVSYRIRYGRKPSSCGHHQG